MPKGYRQCATCGNPVHVHSKKCSECDQVLHSKGGRPKDSSVSEGYCRGGHKELLKQMGTQLVRGSRKALY